MNKLTHYGGVWHHSPQKICQCNYLTQTQENILSHATSVGNKQKRTEERKTFVISNNVSIVSSPSKKEDQNEVHAIKNLIQYSMSSAYRRKKGF